MDKPYWKGSFAGHNPESRAVRRDVDDGTRRHLQASGNAGTRWQRANRATEGQSKVAAQETRGELPCQRRVTRRDMHAGCGERRRHASEHPADDMLAGIFERAAQEVRARELYRRVEASTNSRVRL